MSANSLYQSPITFVPLYQTRVWGGRRLHTLLGRALPQEQVPYGESWEICDRPEEQSLVAEGPWAGKSLHFLWREHRRELFGAGYADHPAERFPLLLKILDACDDLSIQVHPPASVAEQQGGEPKTEMWYIAHAEEDGRIYAGLRAGVTREEFQCALPLGEIAGLVHEINPRVGQNLFLPSGRLHALGRGLLVYEIQQNSDTTYRVFDWNRLGLDGKPRDLHLEESLQCIDFQDFEPSMSAASENGSMAACDYFQVSKITLKAREKRRALPEEKFSIFVVVEGSLKFETNREYKKGDFVFLPASATETDLEAGSAGAEFLEVTLPTL